MAAVTRLDFQFGSADAPAARRRDEGAMRIVLLGDFSGRAARGTNDAATLAERKPLRVDIDNLDAVLGRIAPRLPQPGGGETAFATIDDFHPDALYRRLPVFAGLRDTRARLRDPATFAAAAAELMTSGKTEADSAPAAPADPSALLGNLLGMPAASAAAAAASAVPAKAEAVQALIRHIVGPDIARDEMPQQAQYLASVDAAAAERMRAVLHAPAFQSLESAWRGVQMLVSRLELDEGLQLWLFDASAAELRDDITASNGDLQRSGLWRALVERVVQAPGGEPWSLLAGLYAFDATPADVGLLAALGAVAAQAGGPFIASANPRLAGCESFATTPDPADWLAPSPAAEALWAALRHSSVAPWIGLIAPRFRLRLPYGAATDEIDAFAFEETAGADLHASTLWGHGALAAALLAGQAFTQRGWSMNPGDVQDLDDLPAHMALHEGEKQLQPGAEAYLSERAGNRLLELGLMPLLSYRHRNAARLLRFQSVALPARRLAGLGADA